MSTTALAAAANAGAIKLTAAQAADVKVLATNTTNTIALATATGTADVLGLTLENLTAAAVAAPIDVTVLTATGGFFDAAFKATGVDLTTTAAKGNITIDMTSFTGAAKIAATTAGTGVAEGKLDIQTGTGADTITVSAAAAGVDGVIKTFAGNDKITTTGAEAFAITAGAGNDTIVPDSTGVNTVVFENTAALNGVGTITGFLKTADIINWVQGASEVAVTGALTTTANAFYQLGGLTADKADTAAAVATAVTAGATWNAAAATAWIAASDDNSTAIYEWTDVAGTAGVQESEITLVGTIDAAMTSAELATATSIV